MMAPTAAVRPTFFVVAFSMLVALSAPSIARAQKIGIVDITQVLQAQPDYKRAQEDLEKISQRWRQEIAQDQDVIKGLYNKYQAEQVLMSDDAKRQREEEIATKEKQVREKQREKFGPEGELFKRRGDLVKPIQDKVYATIERFANVNGYDLLLDKNSSSGIIFANPSFDQTQRILDLLRK